MPPTPASGCAAATRGRLTLRDLPTDSLDKLRWRWVGAAIDGADLGTPQSHTDLAVCVYDQSGRLLGGAVPHGADRPAGTSWQVAPKQTLIWRDPAAGGAGIEELRIRMAPAASIQAKGRGGALAMPTLPASLPLRAQLLNLDGGACWESTFATARRNDAGRVVAPDHSPAARAVHARRAGHHRRRDGDGGGAVGRSDDASRTDLRARPDLRGAGHRDGTADRRHGDTRDDAAHGHGRPGRPGRAAVRRGAAGRGHACDPHDGARRRLTPGSLGRPGVSPPGQPACRQPA